MSERELSDEQIERILELWNEYGWVYAETPQPIQFARAVILADRALRCPPGWRLVPEEPTLADPKEGRP